MFDDNQNFDWQRPKRAAASQQPRGNQVLVSYVMNKNHNPVFKASTRCVWPQSVLTNESRFLTRKLTVKAL